ncbi:MAG: HAMP domain-containing protein [Deltaproteobacteria bacterium]|nr:HAMP domain-containing protein [Deltaproteobacteria bacterium]
MTRFVLRIFLGLLVVVIAAFTVAMGVVRLSIHRQLDTARPPLVDLAVSQIHEEILAQPADERVRQAARIADRARMPAILLEDSSPRIPEALRPALEVDQPATAFAEGGFQAAVPLPEGGVLLLGPEPSHIGPTGRDLAVILCLLVGVIGVSSVALARPMVRALADLARAADRIGAGDLAARAPERRQDNPVNQLVRSFNAMAGRVQELLDHQRQLVQAVAHEIRTPIARLRFGLEMAQMARGDGDRSRHLAALQDDLVEMETLTEELLVYSRYEAGRSPPSLQPVPVAATLERQLERLGPLPEGVRVDLAPAPDAPQAVYADARAFNRAVGNLLANAARFARSRVEVTWRAVDGGVEVTVSDDGPGIPAPQRDRVFEPFFRLEQARDRATGGAGLGLAITRRVLEAHQGRVRVEDAPGGGARLVTWWPNR